MSNGIIPVGGHCDAQGYYYTCQAYEDEEVIKICPYIKDGINYQNDCPHNQLKQK